MRRIGALFMVGSACFALASIPAVSSLVSEGVVAGTYFAGSLFFTSAAYLQMRAGETLRVEWWAAAVQLAGTLLFNAETFDAFLAGLSPKGEDLVVWGPDAIGSAFFLVSSLLALIGDDRNRADWLNLAGSVGFGISAVAAYVVPDTGEFANAAAVSGWTLAGAVCFFIAAYILRRDAAD